MDKRRGQSPSDKRRLHCLPRHLGGSLSGAPISPSAEHSRSLPYTHEVAASSRSSRFPTGDLVRMSAVGGNAVIALSTTHMGSLRVRPQGGGPALRRRSQALCQWLSCPTLTWILGGNDHYPALQWV